MRYKRLLSSVAIVACLSNVTAKAEDFHFAEMPKLHVDSMPAQLSYQPTKMEGLKTINMQGNAFSIAKEAMPTTSKSIKPYKFMDDMTFVGVPLFVAGIIAKSEKKSFRQDYNNTHSNTRLITNFHNELDNYTQFAPMILSTGLNLAGVEGRSSFGRYLVSGALSYAIMAAIVNPIKYTAKEMRPDGSTRNSWPSGHTATAFVSATILHKEYGLTRSPWYSFAGYGLATATGIMRVLNNRHWVSDVLSGAGIGIFSTELAYGLSDLIFKGRGLKRNDLVNTHNIIENPSFFSISMGIGLGSKSLDFEGSSEEASDDAHLKFQASTAVGVEGAYFFNKYIGVGGRLRVKSSPIKGWEVMKGKTEQEFQEYEEFKSELLSQYTDNEQKARVSTILNNMLTSTNVTIEQDHITEFSCDMGVYFNFPLSSRFALGSKALIGRSIIQDLDINAEATGNTINTEEASGAYIISQGSPYTESWDFFTLSGNNTWKYGTGISLTYAYKSSFSWKIFVDYDFTRKHYTMTYNPTPYIEKGWPWLYNIAQENGIDVEPQTQTIKKNMNSFVIGGAFCISF